MAQEINIFTTKKMIAVLRGIDALPGFVHHFDLIPSQLVVPAGEAGKTIIISAHIPDAVSFPKAKYILCSKSPHKLHSNVLRELYDLWPLPLTVELIRYLFGRVQERIKYECENSEEHKEHQRRILEMARQDQLTGIATRWYLREYMERKRAEGEGMTCIYFDLDNFKLVNDMYGHMAGDRALAATAEMMQNMFPDGFAARMGGDEFMLVLPGNRDVEAVRQRVNAFMMGLQKYYASTRTMEALSVSAGISQVSGSSGKTIDQLIHEADTALYEAKNAGKAQCRIYREQ